MCPSVTAEICNKVCPPFTWSWCFMVKSLLSGLFSALVSERWTSFSDSPFPPQVLLWRCRVTLAVHHSAPRHLGLKEAGPAESCDLRVGGCEIKWTDSLLGPQVPHLQTGAMVVNGTQ